MTTTMEPTTATNMQTITMRGKDLGRVLHNASLAVSKDDTRPVLNCIHLTIADGKLTAEATDSYMLIEDSAPLGNPQEGTSTVEDSASWSGLLMADQLADLRKRLLSRESFPRECSITFYADDPNGSITFTHDGTTATYPTYDGQFPNTAQLWPPEDEDVDLDAGRISITPAPLVKLAKITGPDGSKGSALAFAFRTKNRPFVVTGTVSGSSFRALVMPYRMD